VHLHLPEVLVGELVQLQVTDDVAAKEAVVEDEVEALVEAGGFLAIEFGKRPAGVGGLDFVKATLVPLFLDRLELSAL